ncbi:hypothetical protein [Tropicibacter alexandrii]|uniref:hypothetical protein n=1 Tax=Tropicibacter alexandrii TaxID=2267683 RepID=UPI0010088EEE|nr:hypothetical protein [Tropicibacter alexandrii]
MAETIKQTEALPASYPEIAPRWVSGQLTGTDFEPDPAQLWQQIERHVAHRWTAREVVWIVEGEGDWRPPLTPATIATVEVWENQSWTETTPPPSPFGGYALPSDGPYRITASVGSGTPPADVVEAFRRLHEYSRGIVDSFKNEPAFTGGEEGIPRAWAAKALHLSGAADLLRNYRRA